MTHKYNSLALSLMILTIGVLILAACGGSDQPADTGKLGGIPTPPTDAKLIPEADAAGARDAMSQGFADQMNFSSITTELYSLPAETPFSNVETYYKGLLKTDNWEPHTFGDMIKERGMEGNAWINQESKEILMLGYTSAPALGGNLLVVTLFVF